MYAFASMVPNEPPVSAMPVWLSASDFVTILMTPAKADDPYTLLAPPSMISMRSMSCVLTGRSIVRCPVWGLVMLIPLSITVSWSSFPPFTPMSVWMPYPPRCLTSTPATNFRRSSTL